MRKLNASMVVVFATLAGASASAWAKVSAQQGNPAAVMLAQAHADAPQPVLAHDGLQHVRLNAVAPAAEKAIARVAEPVRFADRTPDQEKANMGMMILVGLGMLGTVMVKNNRS